MGFKKPVIELSWPEGHELHGFEIKARRPNIDQLFQISAGGDIDAAEPVRSKELWNDTCQALSEIIVSWNLTADDDQPEPCTPQVIAGLGYDMVLEIVDQITGTAKVEPELGKDSLAGQRSVVASIPMDDLSESQAS